MRIGDPGEHYIQAYLEREYDRVEPLGHEKKRRDYRCFKKGMIHLNEGKTDTRIAQTRNIPWEVFRLEEKGQRAYIAWGYEKQTFRVLFFVPQWMEILDMKAADVRAVLFRHIMSKGREIPVVPTLTDEDRITFFFVVPIRLLEEAGALRRIRIAELPLAPEVPMQKPLL